MQNKFMVFIQILSRKGIEGMKKTKRSIALLLAILLLCAALAGCSNEDDPAASPASSPSASSSPAASPADSSGPDEPADAAMAGVMYPIAEEPIEMEILSSTMGLILSYLSEDGYNTYPIMEYAIQATGVRFTWNCVERDFYTQQMSLALASEDYPDVFTTPETSYPGGRDALVADDICINLEPYLEEYAPDFMANLYNQYENYAKTITTDSGNITTIYSVAETVGSGPVIRKDWLDKLDLSVPETYDELYDALYAFKTELNVKHPMMILAQCCYQDNSLSAGYDAALTRMPGEMSWQVDDGGTVWAACMLPQFKEYLLMLNSWVKEGLLTDESLAVANMGKLDPYIISGETGFWSSSGGLSNDFKKQSDDPDFLCIPIAEPTKTSGETVHLGGVPFTVSDAMGWAVSTQCETPEAAIMYINYFFTEEGNRLANIGLEGVSYTVNADGSKSYTDLIINNPDGMAQMIATQLYAAMPVPNISTIERARMGWLNDSQKMSHETWSSNRDDTHVYRGDLTSDEAQTYAVRAGDVATLVDENVNQFVYGAKSFDEWDNFIAQCESMGIHELTALKQAAYDRYLAR